MTTDVREIVARLKGHGEIMERDKGKFVRFIDVATCTEAVDLIEVLAAEIARLREALEEIAKPDYGYMDIIEAGYPPEKHADYFCSMVGWRRRVARAAIAAVKGADQ